MENQFILVLENFIFIIIDNVSAVHTFKWQIHHKTFPIVQTKVCVN